MSVSSKRQRKLRRAAAQGVPVLAGPREVTCVGLACKVRIPATSQWMEVQVFGQTKSGPACPACLWQLRRTGASPSKMHGAAHAARTRHEQKWLWFVQEVDEAVWERYVAYMRQEGRPAVSDSLYGIMAAARAGAPTLSERYQKDLDEVIQEVLGAAALGDFLAGRK